MSARSDNARRSPSLGQSDDRELDRNLSRAVDESAARVADRVAAEVKRINEASKKHGSRAPDRS
jgi:hypothetical protein